MKFYIIVQTTRRNGITETTLQPAPRPGGVSGLVRQLSGEATEREKAPNTATREWDQAVQLMRRIAAQPSRELLARDTELSSQLAAQMPRVRADKAGTNSRFDDNEGQRPISDYEYGHLHRLYQELVVVRTELRSRHGSAKYEEMETAYRQELRDKRRDG
jgi:hypothetical protein